MNEKFYNLEESKQLAIINAGFEVFSKFDYKKASTENMAQKAGISKALLFHYFRNKEAFFAYLYSYAQEKMKAQVYDNYPIDTQDFFESIEQITYLKCQLLKENPYILNFLATATCSKDTTVQGVLARLTDQLSGQRVLDAMAAIDYSPFKTGVEPVEIIEMLAYTLEGYLHHELRQGTTIEIDQIMDKHKIWLQLIKESCYR